jgi:opacity protein-like surface antigen
MSKSAQLLLTTALMLASVSAASAATCQAWYQQCARFHGYNTPDWQACMQQPQAQYDCSGGGGGGYRGGGGYQGGYEYNQGYPVRPPTPGMCGNWRQQCARLYGYRSEQWHECMHQPQALADCGRY